MSSDELSTSEALGHEPLGVRARPISVAVAVLFAGIALALLAVGGLALYLAAVRGGSPAMTPPDSMAKLPPGVPNVDADQMQTLAELRRRERAWLSEYAWVDRATGVARIPIARAIEILADSAKPRTEASNDSSE